MIMNTIHKREEEIVEDFSLFDDWMSKYEYIIDLGKELEPLEEEYKTKENLVRGCQSQVWLHAFKNNNEVIFKADSDALITKGLVSLLVRVLSNNTPEDIIHANLHFIDEIGLKEHLSPNRSNGLSSMIKTMKAYALAFSN